MKHQWTFESETKEEVLWRCTVCRVPLGFAKEGFGEPWATSVAVHPEADPCRNDLDPVDSELVAKVFFATANLQALETSGAITKAEQTRLLELKAQRP
jgi:hypothetical protein